MGFLKKDKPWHSGADRISIAFSFRTDTGSVVAGSLKGQGVASVAYVGTGDYTVTFEESFGQLDSVVGSVREVSGAAHTVTFGVFDSANKTLKVFVADAAGTLVDLADDPDNVINVALWIRDQVFEGH